MNAVQRFIRSRVLLLTAAILIVAMCLSVFIQSQSQAALNRTVDENSRGLYDIHYIQETEATGTAGSLVLLAPMLQGDFFLSNCDVVVKADYAEAFYNCATILQQQARMEEALVAYGQAIKLRPDYADAINNAGIVLQELGRAGQAIDLYRLRRVVAGSGVRNA